MHFSAKRGIAIACRPSVRPSVTLVHLKHIGWKSWKLIEQTPAQLFVRGACGNFGETRGGVGKSGVLEHKSGNISEMRKDRRKATMAVSYTHLTLPTKRIV